MTVIVRVKLDEVAAQKADGLILPDAQNTDYSGHAPNPAMAAPIFLLIVRVAKSPATKRCGRTTVLMTLFMDCLILLHGE